uniref:FLT3 interacting zinc finger 1 n=1 Tax=Naja naja TaxID=35670 RepID=A0A8C6XA47_NAJNA
MESHVEAWPEGQHSQEAPGGVQAAPGTEEECAVLYSDAEDDPSLLTVNGAGPRAPFHCSECDKSFRYRSDLRRHFARHTELKPFQCPHCVKSFKHSFNLVNHIRSHTGERPYRCTMCPKGFRDSTGLLHHQVVHTGEKPYCCHICELRFSSRSSLGRHLKRQVHCTCLANYKVCRVERNISLLIALMGSRNIVFISEQEYSEPCKEVMRGKKTLVKCLTSEGACVRVSLTVLK